MCEVRQGWQQLKRKGRTVNCEPFLTLLCLTAGAWRKPLAGVRRPRCGYALPQASILHYKAHPHPASPKLSPRREPWIPTSPLRPGPAAAPSPIQTLATLRAGRIAPQPEGNARPQSPHCQLLEYLVFLLSEKQLSEEADTVPQPPGLPREDGEGELRRAPSASAFRARPTAAAGGRPGG